MFVRTYLYFSFHTSSSDEILTKNQLEGQFHTPAISLVSNFDRVDKFCGTNSYLFFTPYRVVRFLQRVSLKVNLFTPYRVVRFLQRVSLKVNLFTPYRVVRFLQRVSLKVILFTPYRAIRFRQWVSSKV